MVTQVVLAIGYLTLALALIAAEASDTTRTREFWRRVARAARVFLFIMRLFAGLANGHIDPGADPAFVPDGLIAATIALIGYNAV